MGEKSTFFEDLSTCISSGLAFSSNFPSFLTSLYSEPIQASVKSYLEAMEQVLKSPDSPPASKFYCLLLLLRVTEFENEGLDTFVEELSKSKGLLNKVFQDAQFDKEKAFGEKGNKFFSRNPNLEESIIGNNYVRLTLEVIRFWSETYGSPSKKDPGHIFFVMFTSLGKMLKFPEVYNYVCRSYDITDDFHLRQDFGHEGQVVDQAAINIKAFMQVSSCISSGTEYKLNSKVVFDSIGENSAVYNDSLLDTIAEILESKDYPPKSKFYALYLLIQVTETHNKVFMTRFAHRKNLLTKFAQVVLIDATSKERGGRLFPEIVNTPDAVIGKNYITLLVEAIKYWDVSFGSDDINSPFNAFRTLDSSIWEFVRVPKDYFYVGQNIDPEGGLLGKSLSIIEFPPMILEEPLSSQNNQENFDPIFAIEHVNRCVSSSAGFKEYFKIIAETLQFYSKEYIDLVLKRIYEIINNGESSPSSKFYALYLLAKTTELGNEALILALEKYKELLNKLYLDGQVDKGLDYYERGTKIFAEDPTPEQQILGNHYLNLVLELLSFWSQNYGGENKNSPGFIFHNMVTALSQKKVHFPQKLVYIGKDIGNTLMEIDEQLQAHEESPSENSPNKANVEERVVQNRQEQEVNKENRGASKKENKSIDVEDSLVLIEEAKQTLIELLENNKGESDRVKEMIDTLIKDINEIYSRGLEPNMNNQKYATSIFEEGEINDQINAEYSSFKGRKTTYPDFRNRMLNLLKDKTMSQHTKTQKTEEVNPRNNEKMPSIKEMQGREERPENNNIATSGRKEVKDVRLRTSESAKKGDSLIDEKSLSSKGFDATLSASKRKIPEAKLMSSLKEIEKSINLSRVKAADLSQIEESIKKSFIRNDKKPPVFEPLDELKRKEKLEQEIARLKKEKLNLSSSFLRSQILQESPGSQKGEGHEEEVRNIPRGSEISRGFGFERSEDYVNTDSTAREYQQMVDDLQRKVEQANEELQKKVFEVENLKKVSQDTNGIQLKKIQEENKALRNKLEETRNQLQGLRSENTLDKPMSKRREILSSRNQKIRESSELQIQHKSPRGSVGDDLVQKGNKSIVQKTEVIYGKGTTTHHRGSNPEINVKGIVRSAVYDQPERSELIMKQKSPKEQSAREDFRTVHSERFVQTAQNSQRVNVNVNKQGEKTLRNGNHSTPDKNYNSGDLEDAFETPKSQFSRAQENGSDLFSSMTGKNYEISEGPGRLIEHDNQFLQALREELINSQNPQELHNYKLNCFKSKTVLYESSFLQIGATSALLTDSYYQRRLLKTVLYFANRSPDYIDGFVTAISTENSLTHVLKPETVHTTIEPGKQVKQQIITLIQRVPFECPQLNGEFIFRHNKVGFGFYLPSVITKFMEFKYIDLQSYERKWAQNSENILKTNMVLLDPNVVRSGHDFKKYFNYLIDLKLMDEYDFIQGKKSLDIGGVFELDLLGVEYMLKISIFPSRKAVFQVAANQKDYEIAKYILETLVFLFQA